jgi:hypothetical protein
MRALDRPLLFLHIPKTGGMSLWWLLKTRFDDAATLRIGGSEAQRLAQTAQIADSSLVAGHVGFEIVSRFPCFPAVVTLLRDPIARAVSAFGHLRAMDPDTVEQEEFRREIRRAKEYDLLGYIESDPAAAADHLGNVQTWHVSSDGVWRRGVAKLTGADLARAKHNLRRCASVGLTERFAISLEVLCSVLSWEPFGEVPHVNQGSWGVSATELDARVISALTEMTRLDAELYRSAAEELDQRFRSAVSGRSASKLLA